MKHSMKAFTIYQPFATLICAGPKPGPKRIENRTWPPPKHIIGKRIAIHAGRVTDGSAALKYEDTLLRLMGGVFDLPKGAILGSAIVWGHVTHSDDEWFIGPYGWSLSNVWTLREPIPYRGAQGLWNVPDELEPKLSQFSAELYFPI